MPDSPSSHQLQIPPERSGRWRGDGHAARDALARAIPRRPRVSWWLGIVLALGFAAVVTPAITAERWLFGFQRGAVVERQPARFTVRAPMLAGYDNLRVGGGVVVARGEVATRDEAAIADAIADALPSGPALYGALFALVFVLAAIFTHHMRRSTKGRLVRVQIVSLAVIAALAVVAKALMLATALSALIVPVAALAMVPTLVLDRTVGIATGVLAALVTALLAPFDVGLAILLLVQAASAGLMVAERPRRRRWRPALVAGLVATLGTGATYVLLTYLTTGRAPELADPLHAAWLAAAIGPALAAIVAVPAMPLYQLLVGEITQSRLIALEDLGHPLLRQIAEKAPGSWQHSLMMANMAEIAANAIGASGRLVRVGAYFHDLGKSLSPKYFIENLEPGETSPHDQLPPEVSCDAIFAHVTEGIAAARRARLHERVIDFMHMHHGDGVLEYFWAKCREQGNPHGYTIEQFRYPGHPPQSRETAILTICDAVEAASRTLKKPEPAAIDALVQRIVYGKLHLGQLDESGLSMSDLRRISDSLRETIRHANHGRIEYPWQKAEQDASASAAAPTTTAPRLDSLDRKPGRDSTKRPRLPPPASDASDALAATAEVKPAARPEVATVDLGPPAGDVAIDATAPAAQIQAVRTQDRDDSTPVAVKRSSARVASVEPAAARRGAPSEPPATVERAAPPATVERAAPPATVERAAPPATVERAAPPATVEPPAEPAVDETADDPLPPVLEAPRPVRIEPRRAAADEAVIAPRQVATTLPGRAPGPAPSDAIGPETFEAGPAARKRAATLPPIQQASRPPTKPPPLTAPRREPVRAAGPPEPVDLDSATTNPPPLRRTPAGGAPQPQDPAQLAAALQAIVARVADAPFGRAELDAATTQPSIPALPAVVAAPSAPRAAAPHVTAAITQPSIPVAVPLPDEPAPSARTRTASASETGAHPKPRRAPSVAPPASDAPWAVPALSDAEEAVTIRRAPTSTERRASTRPPAEQLRPPFDPRPRDDEPVTAREPAADDEQSFAGLAGPDLTEPSLPVLAVGDERKVRRAAPPRKAGWSSGLAARIDAKLDHDEWGVETPVAPPTRAELRALTDHPDPTRQQAVDEIELLQRRAAELAADDPPRRAPHPTAEVDPDDIEAAIEVAPPARRPHVNAIGARPKKRE
jgi:putative nucleotidyltransferase with HDIG domain